MSKIQHLKQENNCWLYCSMHTVASHHFQLGLFGLLRMIIPEFTNNPFDRILCWVAFFYIFPHKRVGLLSEVKRIQWNFTCFAQPFHISNIFFKCGSIIKMCLFIWDDTWRSTIFFQFFHHLLVVSNCINDQNGELFGVISCKFSDVQK